MKLQQLMFPSVFLALLVHLALATPQKPAKDPCEALAKQPSWTQARECLSSFPYTPETHRTTQDTVMKIVPLYVFLDIARSTPDKEYQEDYDLMPNLNSVFEKKDYKNDMEFQEAIYDAFVPLNDAHTGYLPNCYRQIAYAQPFYPVAHVGKDGKTRLIIQAIGKNSPEYDKYLGAELLLIDGKDAVNHIWDWSFKDNVGLNKDPMTRFNRALARMEVSGKGEWSPYAGDFMMRTKLPGNEYVSYAIKPEGGAVEHVTVPWRVVLPSTRFENARWFWLAFCQYSEDFIKNDDRKLLVGAGGKDAPLLPNQQLISRLFPVGKSLILAPKDGDVKTAFLPEPVQLEPSVVKGESSIRKPIFVCQGLAFYTLESNDKIGVLVISTFSLYSREGLVFRKTLADVFSYINKNNIKNLMLELSGNGGGSGCLASEIVALLTPHLWEGFPTVQNQFKKDERFSPLMEKLHHVAYLKNNTSFNPRTWIDADTNKNFLGEEMYKPSRQRPHSNGLDPYPYTQLFYDECENIVSPLQNVTHSLKPRDIAVISDGMCGSACGRVHFHLAELNSVKSVVVGGFKNRTRTASGFPATQVLGYESIIAVAGRLELSNDTDIPQLLPEQVVFRFAVRESYSRKNLNTPLEFVSLPADIELEWDSWTAMRPDRMWEQAAVQLEWL